MEHFSRKGRKECPVASDLITRNLPSVDMSIPCCAAGDNTTTEYKAFAKAYTDKIYSDLVAKLSLDATSSNSSSSTGITVGATCYAAMHR